MEIREKKRRDERVLQEGQRDRGGRRRYRTVHNMKEKERKGRKAGRGTVRTTGAGGKTSERHQGGRMQHALDCKQIKPKGEK